jgi:hypothetical protein
MKIKEKRLGKGRELILTTAQRDKLLECITGQGGNQTLFRRINDNVGTKGGKIVTLVYEADMERLEKLAARDDTGTWQDWAREVLAANP